jgi:hypothetical protein
VRLRREHRRELGDHGLAADADADAGHTFHLAFQQDSPKGVGDIGEGQRSRDLRALDTTLAAARASLVRLHAPWLRNVVRHDPAAGTEHGHAPARTVHAYALTTTFVGALLAALAKDAEIDKFVDDFVKEADSYAYAVEPGAHSPLATVLHEYQPGPDEVTMRFGARGIMRMRALLTVLPAGQTPTWFAVLPLLEQHGTVSLLGDLPNIDTVGPVIAWLFDQMEFHLGAARRG